MTGHLIHIGYPKAGSTFLQAWFERHPELRYAPGGLGGFHTVYEIARPSAESYKYYVTSSEALSTPHNSAGGIDLSYGGAEPDTNDRTAAGPAAVCSVLKALYPGSRILIVTRGFRGMVLSAHSQYVRMGGRLHLGEMCRQMEGLLQNGPIHLFDIDSLLRLYGDAFGEENLIVMPYELLRDDQGRFLAILEGQLGLAHAEIEIGRVNPSLSPEELYWYPIISRAVSAAAARLGEARFRRVYAWYMGRTLDNRLRLLVKVLSRLKPGRRITGDEFPTELFKYWEGKASRLKDNPLYAPYATEYLWEAERGSPAS